MSVSSFPVDDREQEENDLVKLFQNSRIPRGSDAFQSIMDGLLTPEPEEIEEEETDEVFGKFTPPEDDVVMQLPEAPKKEVTIAPTVRIATPKTMARVRFPDPEESKDIGRRRSEPRHFPRLFVKTTPTKPILKHDDLGLVGGTPVNQT